MGHAFEILTFSENTPKSTIIAECNSWASYNVDRYESDPSDGLPYPVNFTDMVFDSYKDAEAYLNTHSLRDYKELAVKFKAPKKNAVKTSKPIMDKRAKITKYQDLYRQLDNKVHYAGVKSKTIKCRNCAAILPTLYIKKTFTNKCPVCRSDLRPATVTDKLNKYMQEIKKLNAELKELEALEEKKAISKGFEYKWAVACEVHC